MAVRVPPQRLVVQIAPLLRRFLLALQGVPVSRETVFWSWYRNPEQNRLAKGHVESQHLAGLAIDVSGLPAASLDRLRRNGLVVVPFESHVHVQLGPAGFLRREGLLELVTRV